MSQIEANDTVVIEFEGKLDNGEVFKTVTKDKPISITLGDGNSPPTLEQALMGMSIGEKKVVRLPPEEGYGPRQKELLQEIELSTFGDKIEPKPGMVLSLTVEKEGDSHKIPATVIEIKDNMVIVDYNHPLAGHHLTYHLTVLDIKK
jgi:FKBP-type peptidyl-prolyl cis-trans isomerase 2